MAMSTNEPTNDRTNEPTSEPVQLREPSIALTDLTSELLWLRILRAPALALSPSRLLAGSICAFLLGLVLTIVQWLGLFAKDIETIESHLSMVSQAFSESVAELDITWMFRSGMALINVVLNTIVQSPLLALVVGLPMIAILALAGGAISRSAAFEFAQGRFASSDDTLGFTLRRTRHFVGAVVGPILACAAIFLVIALGGLLLSVPVLDVLGSLLYGLGLALGLLATIIVLLHLVALPMIVPALAIEGTDAFDAVQRAYAYVIAKPLRYAIYIIILTLVGVLAASLFSLIAYQSITLTQWAATLFSANATERAITGAGELGATKAWAHDIINIWHTIIELAIAGYAISLFFTSSTLLYLVTRRICDGQGINEVWDGIGE